MRVLVAGASGFVGRRLCPAVEDAGHEVLAMTRHPGALRGRGHRRCAATCTTRARCGAALGGCDAAYYLVHSLDDAGLPAQRDADAARAFARPRRRRRGGPDRLPRRARRRRRRPVPAPAQPPRGRGAAGRRRGAGDGAARRHRGRPRRHLLGDDPPARRAPAGHGHARGGCAPAPSRSRSPTSSATSSGCSTRRSRRPGVRHRRARMSSTYMEMMRRVAAIEGRRMLVVPVPLLSPAAVLALALAGHRRRRADRSLADRLDDQRGGRARRRASARLVPFEPMDYDEPVLPALGERARERGRQVDERRGGWLSRGARGDPERPCAPAARRVRRAAARLLRSVPRDHRESDEAFRRRRRVAGATAVTGAGLLGVSLSTPPGLAAVLRAHPRRRPPPGWSAGSRPGRCTWDGCGARRAAAPAGGHAGADRGRRLRRLLRARRWSPGGSPSWTGRSRSVLRYADQGRRRWC